MGGGDIFEKNYNANKYTFKGHLCDMGGGLKKVKQSGIKRGSEQLQSTNTMIYFSEQNLT